MLKSRLASIFSLAALLCWVALAAGIDGKWTAETQGKNGPQTQTPMLKSAGDKLTGTMEGAFGGATEITDGMIHGTDVMFKVVREFNGNKFEQKFKGTMSGSELKLTIEAPAGGKGKGGPREV